MIVFVYPHALNWFYQWQAEVIAADLRHNDHVAVVVSSQDLAMTGMNKEWADDVALVFSYAECIAAARIEGHQKMFRQSLSRFKKRILVNYDCVYTDWFAAHFTQGFDYFDAIFDVGMVRQYPPRYLETMYCWIPEAFTTATLQQVTKWDEGRPIPWAIVGHATTSRAALIATAVQTLSPDGFVFAPPLAPFDGDYGLNRLSLRDVLLKTDFYIWGSHHVFPFHEALRVVVALDAGAIPVKIDPLYCSEIQLPWVYESLESFRKAERKIGRDQLYEQALDRVVEFGTLGASFAQALSNI